MRVIRFVVDGREVEVRDVDPNVSLLHWLRATGRTGTKEGCAEGECGACAVAWRTLGPDGRARWEAVNSCLVLLPMAHGREIVTSEGIADGDRLHPVQAALAEGGSSQCGYCTPGFVVSLFGEFYRSEDGPLDVEAIAGNLCRCTGYRPIRDAAEKLATLRVALRPDDRHRARLGVPVEPLGALRYEVTDREAKRRSFVRPTSLPEALEILACEPERVLVHGGTDVVVEVNQRDRRHVALMSLEAVPELRVFQERDDALVIGAGVPLAEVEERLHRSHLGRALPMLTELLTLFASRLVRARATFGGNLGTASPIGDGPPVLLALDAELVLASWRGGAVVRRTVPLTEFFVGYRRTLREPDEIIELVRIPKPFPAVQRFYKVSKRRLDDISSVAAAFALECDAKGIVTRARLAYGGVAPLPVRIVEAEAALIGRTIDPESIERAAALASEAVRPIDDHRASARYRTAMVVSLLRKLAHDVGVAPVQSASTERVPAAERG